MSESESLILLEKVGEKNNIALITLNRQKALNAFNIDMLNLLEDTFNSLRDEDIRAIIIYAEGKSWSAGADLKGMQLSESGKKLILRGQEVFATIEEYPYPVIAAINGYALGGGTELALACDIRIASESALFGQPETTLGLPPGWGATYRLPKVVGMGTAKELIFTGRKFPAEEALKMNLISKVCKAEELKDVAIELAEKIAMNAPVAIKEAKKAINKSVTASLEEGYKAELQGAKTCFETEDILEGIQAIFEKRKPEFKGK